MTNYTKHFNTRQTPQSDPIPGKDMVKNSAGGYTFEIDDFARLERFLILGAEGGTYYADEKTLTVENANCVVRCLKEDGYRTVDTIVKISKAGRAPKNDAAIFAMALAVSPAFATEKTRTYAFDKLGDVVRIGTHLFQFMEVVKNFRGYGRGLRTAVSKWYTSKDTDALGYQMAKYRNRHNWTHRDVLRVAHPDSETHRPLFDWVTQGNLSADLPQIVLDFENLQNAGGLNEIVQIVRKNPDVPWEFIPNEYLGSKDVWNVLLPNMNIGALVRNLGRLTANGTIEPMSDNARTVVAKLQNEDTIKGSRIHPINILVAMLTYQSGSGFRGSLSWSPVPQIIDALEDAYYMAFDNVEPAGKRTMISMDISGSMGWSSVAGIPLMTPREGAIAMAMVTTRTEPEFVINGFSHELIPLQISAHTRLDDAIRHVEGLPFGRTDCSLPMMYALKNNLKIDTFAVYTDNETWYGNIHPVQALQQYRQRTGIPARLVVCSMTATSFSIADPNDAGMLDVVGFDTSTPRLISEFSAGNF